MAEGGARVWRLVRLFTPAMLCLNLLFFLQFRAGIGRGDPDFTVFYTAGTVLREAEEAGQAREARIASIPAGRFTTAAEVAEVVRFLAGDGASYITGQTIHVNGGLYI